MSYAFYSQPVNGVSEVGVVRDGLNKISILTVEPLSDKQVEQIYWLVYIMMKTGKSNIQEILNAEKGE